MHLADVNHKRKLKLVHFSRRLMELQSRFSRPAPTCDPAVSRTYRQETPWIHRGLGIAPPLLLSFTFNGAYVTTSWETNQTTDVFVCLFIFWAQLLFFRGWKRYSRIRPRQLPDAAGYASQLSCGAPAGLTRIQSTVWHIVEFSLSPTDGCKIVSTRDRDTNKKLEATN